MKIFTLCREQELPIAIEEAWAFFSSPKNLDKITPPDMGFVIKSQLNEGGIFRGMKIQYIVKPLLGIPLKWITEISEVDAPFLFTDKQLKGPYALWEHTHYFTTVPGGVKMRDEVKYGLPLGWLGLLAHTLVVRKKLDDIFNYRRKVLEQFFAKKSN
jgi:ligand-binding SRPBCC domain-containing protein